MQGNQQVPTGKRTYLLVGNFIIKTIYKTKSGPHMKTIYFLYAILFKKFSVMQIDYYINGKEEGRHVVWWAMDGPHDGYGGHQSNCAESNTAIQAVWELRKIHNNKRK
jgi:hypothetical protein